jgi:hypothetical protein
VAALPDYIPEAVAAEYARLREEWADWPDALPCLDRLIFRPCMEKVYRGLDKHLSGKPAMRSPSGNISTPWAWFLEIAFSQEDAPSFLARIFQESGRISLNPLIQLGLRQ